MSTPHLTTTLQAWRDALTSGGFPTPTKKRWQPLRAGVVNLWEFEATEYWYADGWAQLMGRNETGKSSLMALTTLIPWLGDTSSDKIDTLGRSGKQFAYYVRPSGENDRRDTDASLFHGWLWVEYGRCGEDTDEYFTTLLYASARPGSTATKLTWCTSNGSRVRGDLALALGRDVRKPKDIDAPGFEPYPTAAAYKQALATQLLGGSVHQLDSIGKLLKVTRQPKLGAQLNVDFVARHLRDSLPELNRAEVEELAHGWDQLDQLREDVDKARQATADIARFHRDAYKPWATALLRLRADTVAMRQTACDKITREETAATAEMERSTAEKQRLTEARHTAHTEATTSRAQAEALRASATYREASSRLENATRQEHVAHDAERTARRSAAAHTAAEQRAAQAHQTYQRHHETQRKAAQAVQHRSDVVRGAAQRVGVECPTPLNEPLLRQRLTERRANVGEVARLLGASERAEHAAAVAEKGAEARQDAADEARRRAETAWEHANTTRDTCATQLHAWAPPPLQHRVEVWVEGLPRSSTHHEVPRLIDILRDEAYTPQQQRLTALAQQAALAGSAAEDAARAVADEMERLNQQGVSHPTEPALWRRRNRVDAEGAPFWKLVNPRNGVPAEELAHLEAALAASGLLDAWASPHTTDLDTYLTGPAAPPQGRRLGEVLEVASDAGEAASLVQAVLDGVVVCAAHEPLPERGAAVALDGRWRTSALTGSCAPRHAAAEWLGEAAREEQRRRRLAELRAHLAEHEADAASHRATERQCYAELADVTEKFAQAPTDDALRAALTRCGAADDAAEAEQTAADALVEHARKARTTADAARAEVRRIAHEHRLPLTSAELDHVQTAIAQTETELTSWGHAHHLHAQAELAAQETHSAWQQLVEEAHQHHQDQERDHQAWEVARARADALRAAINDDDNAILQRLATLENRTAEAEQRREELEEQRAAAEGRAGRAEMQLTDVVRRRTEAAEERAHAHREFRELIDHALAESLAVELPDAHSAAIEHVRAQAAVIRRVLTPRTWQDSAGREGRTANQRRVEALRRAVDDKARDTRSALERSGASLMVFPADPVVRVEVRVNAMGHTVTLDEAGPYLANLTASLEAQYGESVRETLDRLLGSTFVEHMRERIGQAHQLVDDINAVLRAHSTGTDGTTLRIALNPGENGAVLAAITGPTLLDPQVAEQVRSFLKDRVDEAKRAASDAGREDWRESLAVHLDYRTWYDISLEHRVGAGRWAPLTPRRYAELSGGARAVMLMLPLVAALAAHYQHVPHAPRPLWLDEAFDGLDTVNRSMVMSLLHEFDLDVLLAGPGRLVTVDTVPTAAIYQVVRAPAPTPGADLTVELWAGNTLEALDFPLSWLDAPPHVPEGQGTLL